MLMRLKIFAAKILYAFPVISNCATCPALLDTFHLATVTLADEKYFGEVRSLLKG